MNNIIGQTVWVLVSNIGLIGIYHSLKKATNVAFQNSVNHWQIKEWIIN